MKKGIFIVGTGTGVGKTFVSSGIINALKREKFSAGYFKPLQSGVDEQSGLTDIEFVKNLSETDQDIKDMNSYSFEELIAPHLAAERDGTIIEKKLILDKYQQLKKQYDYMIVEGAGGVIVPILDDYYIYDLVRDMNLSALVVADAVVGTINHTCLTVDFLKRSGIEVNGIIINNYSGTFYEMDNIKQIEKYTNIEIKLVIDKLNNGKYDLEKISELYDRIFDKNTVLSLFEQSIKNEE